MISETSIQFDTQERKADNTVSFDSAGHPIFAQGLSQARKQATQKPRFSEFMCSYNEVHLFLPLSKS